MYHFSRPKEPREPEYKCEHPKIMIETEPLQVIKSFSEGLKIWLL